MGSSSSAQRSPARDVGARDVGVSLLDFGQRGTTRGAACGYAAGSRSGGRRESGTSPEERAWLPGKLLFTWAFPVMWSGYRRGQTDLEDLPPLPSFDQPERLGELISDAWRRRQRGGGGRPPGLLRLLTNLVAHLWLANTLVLSAVVNAAQYMQPILLHRLLGELSAEEEGRASTPLMVLDALMIAFSVTVQWVFAEYTEIQYRKGDLRLQAGLTHMVYRKGLYIQNSGSRYTVGELQNLFATDCTKPKQNAVNSAASGIFWTIITVVVGCWHLTTLVGSGGLVALGVMGSFAPIQYGLVSYTKRMVRKVQKARDARGRLLNQFLSAMRVVKCFQLEEVALQQISEARAEELKWQWRKRVVYPFNNFLGSSASMFGTAAAFTWFVLVLGRPLEPALAFTVLSWNNLLKSALLGIPNQCVSILDAYVGIQRVEKFLLEPTTEGQWQQPLPSAGVRLPVSEDSAPSTDQAGGQALGKPHGGADFRLTCCDVGFPVASGGHRGIQSLSLTVRPGELLVVCGPIGCGKSVLLEALTGTRKPLHGGLGLSGRSAAYAAQKAWLLNGTLLENVLFGRELDEGRLQQAIDCCSLGPDLAVLPDGLHSLVGEEGVQLSGGQKQRVSLARAVYSEADVVILDDVMSALDAHVGQHIWEAAICGALAGKTRILATHQVHYCSHPAVDRILVLGAQGAVEHLGSYHDLSAKGVKFAGAGGGSVAKAEENGADAEGVDEASLSRAHEVRRELSRQPEPDPTAELRRLGRVRREDFVQYLYACGGVRCVGPVVSLLVAYYGFQLASNWELAVWTNTNAAAEQHGGAADGSQQYLKLYLLLAFATGLCSFIFFMSLQLVSLRSSRVLHELFSRSLMLTELRFYDTTPTGRILNRCLKDFELIDAHMPAAMRLLAESIMNFAVALAILVLFAWEALLTVPFLGGMYWLVMVIYRWPARDLKRLEGLSRSPMMAHFADSVKGSDTIRAYGHEARFLRHNMMLMGDVQRTSYWFMTAQGWLSTVQEVLGTMLLAVISGTLGYRASAGSLSPGLAGLAMSYALSMPRDLMWLSRRIASVEVDFVSVERVLEYLRLPPEKDVQVARRTSGPNGQVPLPTGGVVAKDVWMRYSDDLPWVLRGLTLEIPVGSRAAVVGRTGCGKSSLLSALARLYTTSSGRLSVHGLDVMETPLANLRRAVRVLLQDPIFFSGTIRSNLLCCVPNDGASGGVAAGFRCEDGALWQALAHAGLEEKVRSLPNGLDERVEEGGSNFSHGERQLLCLARVLTEPPSSPASPRATGVLLCDEPTSACDLSTDEHIHATLLHRLPETWTLVVVCHRLHRIREFSQVCVLDIGQVVEQGPPNALLAKGETGGALPGALAAMCQQQGVA